MTISYSYEQSEMKVVDGQKTRHSHSIVDGDKGATYYFLSKSEKAFKKVKIIEKEGVFEVKMKVNEDEEKSMSLSLAELKKMVKGDKDLSFIEEYMKETKKGGKRKSSKKVGGATGGRRRVSKKVSKRRGGATGLTGGRRRVSKKVSKRRGGATGLTGGRRRVKAI